MDKDSRRTFDRIITYPISLPPPSPAQLSGILGERLTRTAAKKAVDSADTYVRDMNAFQFALSEFVELVALHLRTIRELERFIRSVDMTFLLVEDACHPLDVLRMEFIRHRHPSFHRAILNIYYDLVEMRWGSINDGGIHALKAAFEQDSTAREKRIAKFLEDADIGNTERQLFTDLLSDIFPAVRNASKTVRTGYDNLGEEYERERRLAHPKFWERYFRSQRSEGEISESDILGAIQAWKRIPKKAKIVPVIQNSLDQYLAEDAKIPDQRKTRQFLNNLLLWRNEILKSEVLCDAVITAIANNIDRFSAAGHMDFWTSDRDDAQRVITHLLPGIIPSNRPPLLLNLINSTASLFLVIHISSFPRLEWAKLTSESEFAKTLAPEMLQLAAKQKIEKELHAGRTNIFEDHEQQPLAILGEWIRMHDAASMPAAIRLATDYFLKLASSSPSPIIWLHEMIFNQTKWGKLTPAALRNIFDLVSLENAISTAEKQEAKEKRLGPKVAGALHQLTNWLHNPT